ncbi:MAG: Holliday junction branch migration protein RuvA [Ruminococcus sp.]|nr:Holliday junction branch migration protein RuvA [Ruminococcus sp.]
MIYSVRGKLIYSQNETVVVECAGVGYECRTSFSTIQAVAGKDEVMLYTHLSVREDAVELFGFATKEELKSFRMLIGVSGVGPKAAISILSSCTPSQFALAVATGDSASFTKIKGIGAKTAQRIVLELKDKVAKENTISVRGDSGFAVSPAAADNVKEALTALVVLGYSDSEASSAVSKLDPTLPTEELIKKALMSLARFR